MTSPETHMASKPTGYRQEGMDGRTIVARWILRVNEDGSKETAALHVSHWGNPHYAYRATLYRTQIHADRGTGCTGESYGNMMSGADVLSIPAKRFSFPKLKEAVKAAVAVVNDPANAAKFRARFDADIPVS